MKKVIIIALVVLLNSFDLVSQNAICFKVVDENLAPIANAIVFCKKQLTGAYSKSNGSVTLKDIEKSDTIKISCIGFRTTKIVASNIADTLVLSPSSVVLEEFNIKSEYKRKIIGIKRTNFIQSSSLGRYAGHIQGIVFPVINQAFLEKVELYIEKPEDSSRILFRLLVFEVDDSTNLPTNPIHTEQRTFDVINAGWRRARKNQFDLLFLK